MKISKKDKLLKNINILTNEIKFLNISYELDNDINLLIELSKKYRKLYKLISAY